MRSLAAPCVALASLFLAGLAHAQTPASAAPEPASSGAAPSVGTTLAPGEVALPDGPVVSPAEPDQPVLEPIPNARDLLTGHFELGAALGAKWPFGSFNSVETQRSVLGPALALNLDLGVGLSRNVVLGVWGELGDYSAPPDCPACASKSFAGGPFLAYHVVQGTRFDPWGSLAIGLRQTNIDNTGSGGHSSEHFLGAEFLRLGLGGNWYASSNVALGPYFELDMGADSAFSFYRLYTDIGTGLRVTLDFPGK